MTRQTGPGGLSRSSNAAVLSGLVAVGEDVLEEDGDWVKNGNTIIDALSPASPESPESEDRLTSREMDQEEQSGADSKAVGLDQEYSREEGEKKEEEVPSPVHLLFIFWAAYSFPHDFQASGIPGKHTAERDYFKFFPGQGKKFNKEQLRYMLKNIYKRSMA